MPRAAGLADDIEARFGVRPELIKGKDGVFEIVHDGQLLYSKKATGRFPEAGEVEKLLAERLA